MILIYLGYLALSFGAGVCASHGTAKRYASADEVFSSHMERIRRKRSVDTDEVVGLLQQGVEVADKIHNVFNKVSSLNRDNLTEVIEVGKEAMEAGQEAVEVGEKAFEVGKDAVYATKDFLDQHPEIMQAGKTMGTTLTQVSVYIGPALGGVGVAFAVMAMVSKKEGTPETDAITKGLEKMNERFDQISNQIDQLSGKIDFYEAIKPYQSVRNSLENVHRDYLNLAEVPSSIGYRRTFEKACDSQKVEPLQALEKLHRIIVNPGPEDQPHMLEAIINHYNLDYKMIMGWFERITVNAYTLAMLRSACFGALFGKTDTGMAHTLNQTQNWFLQITQELARYEEKFTNIDPTFIDTFEKELNEVVAGASEVDSKAEDALNGVCNTTEKERTNFYLDQIRIAFCVGHPVNNPIRVAVNTFLNTKYYWLNWLVVVYTVDKKRKPEAGDQFSCSVGKNSRHFVNTKARSAEPPSKDDLRVFVTWARKDAVEAANFAKEGYDELQKWLIGYDPNKALRKETKFGQTGTHFDLYKGTIDEEMGKWYQGLNYTRKLFCSNTYEMMNGEFHRSMMTSGVGYYQLLGSNPKTIDYILAFY